MHHLGLFVVGAIVWRPKMTVEQRAALEKSFRHITIRSDFSTSTLFKDIHTLQLNRLPVDILRPIVALIDAESLGQLFATLDLKMQSLLAQPKLFSTLSIFPSTHPAKTGPYRYFVSGIRDVDHLRLEQDCAWSPRTLLHLKTLNPRHLVLKFKSLHESVKTLLSDAQQATEFEELLASNRSPNVYQRKRQNFDELVRKAPELRNLAQNFVPGGLPNFRLLTTRLETLDLSSFSTASDWVLEPILTLIKFCGPSGFNQQCLLGPSTLTSLSLRSSVCLETLFTQLPVLQDFKLIGNIEMLSPSFVLPTTLTHLDLEFGNQDSTVASFITNSSLRDVPLETMTFKLFSKLGEPIDLGMLPTTLKSLIIDVSTYYSYNAAVAPVPYLDLVTSLPTWLVRFVINMDLLQRLQYTDFSTWTSLEHLEVVETHNSSFLTNLSSLPIYSLLKHPIQSRLKTFAIKTDNIDCLSTEEIQSLPSTLKTLELPSLNPDTTETLISHLPDCLLSIKGIIIHPVLSSEL